jgi:hypothetical protein
MKAMIFTRVLVLMLTFMCCIAYIILAKTLLTPVAVNFFKIPDNSASESLISCVFVACVTPLCFLRTMSGNKMNAIVSITAVCILGIVVIFRSAQKLDICSENLLELPRPEFFDPANSSTCGTGYNGIHTEWQLAPKDLGGPLFAFPITSVAYLCHFNVLPVHEELERPTRRRLKSVIHWTMGFCWAFYTSVGLAGYFYAFDPMANGKCKPESCHGVDDVILRNFSNGDPAINIGRIGLSITLAASYPLLVIPCRCSTLYSATQYAPCTYPPGRVLPPACRNTFQGLLKSCRKRPSGEDPVPKSPGLNSRSPEKAVDRASLEGAGDIEEPLISNAEDNSSSSSKPGGPPEGSSESQTSFVVHSVQVR